VSILEDLDAISAGLPTAGKPAPIESQARPHSNNPYGGEWGRRSPRMSPDLHRVLSLPYRDRSKVDLEAVTELMTSRLRRERATPCSCQSRGRRCILRLKPVQAWALYELARVGGILGAIGVGAGKAGLNILAPTVSPGCKSAVLLLPPKLVDQFIREYELWDQHWHTPTLVHKKQAWIDKTRPGRPSLYIVPYSRLSRHEATELLLQLDPDLVIGDEAHHLRNIDTARGARFLNLYRRKPDTGLCAWSGGLTDRTILDYNHFASLALGDRSPLPLDPEVAIEWSNAIDPPPPDQDPAAPGALSAMIRGDESLHSAYQRRLLDTLGVIATSDSGCPSSLYMHARDPGKVPQEVINAINTIRSTGMRPDGEELLDALAVSRCAREMASGFYYYWTFPNGEPKSLIESWLEARKHWHAAVRAKLTDRVEHLDSPLLLAMAAERHAQGYKGPAPTWNVGTTWTRWRDLRSLVKPKTEAEWISTYLVDDAAKWGAKNIGIVWYQYRAFGAKLAERSGMPRFGGGKDAVEILKERGDRTIIASINSHGEGRDGLQRIYDTQLVANPPESKRTGGAAKWEQLIGRLHREGQEAPVINTYVYRHTQELCDAWDRARQLALYVTDTVGSFQKILASDETW